MALPTPGKRFPSDEWDLAFKQFEANDAWFSGDQEKLQRVYSSTGNGSSRGDNPVTHYNKGDGTKRSGGLRGFLARMFNGRIVSAEQHRTRIHAPVAQNLATLSADLLTAEPPTFRLVDADGKSTKGKAQERLDLILNGAETHRTLSHGAELAAGIGAVVLTANWDRANSEHPWLEAVACDAAVPEFVGRRLAAVNLYSMHVRETLAGVIENVYIHIERHEPGMIVHALYKASVDVGDWGGIGEIVPLDTIEATEHLANIPGSRMGSVFGTVELPTGIQSLTASWWRNLPTKTFRKQGRLAMLGRADFEGAEQLLDAVDEVWSSWMRDIKIARARLIVPESFLELQGPGLGGSFDDDQEILTPLNFVSLNDGETIRAEQFEIRWAEHQGTLLGLTKEITQFAGYSMSTYGENGDTSKTATEVVDRTTLTERTRDKKFLYMEAALQPMARALMELDAIHYGGVKIPTGQTLEISITELSQIDPEKEARVFQYLRTAMAVSTDTLVRAQHRDWDEPEILREIARVREESGLDGEIDAALEERAPAGPEDIDPDEADLEDDEPEVTP